MQTDSDTAKAYRAARRYYGRATGALRPAGLALDLARNNLAKVAAARAAYEVANPVTADANARGALPIDAAEGHAARSRYVEARAKAGLFATGTGWQTWPDTDSAFRDTVAAHDVPGPRFDCTGFYVDSHCDSTIYGVVCQLPGKGGFARYVAGWQHSDCDGGPSLDLGTIYESRNDSSWDTPEAQQEAARAAHGMAETAAESERDYQEAWARGSQWADLGETIAKAKAEIRELMQERRAARAVAVMLPPVPATCRHLKRAVTLLWADIQEARQERADLAGGIWWSRHDDSALVAFADGAGVTMRAARGLCS